MIRMIFIISTARVGTISPTGIVRFGHARRLRLMGKYLGHRLVARRELDNTFWTDSTIEVYNFSRWRFARWLLNIASCLLSPV